MKTALHFTFSFIAFMMAAIATAQTDHFAYAVTDVTKDGVNWSVLRKLDLGTGAYSDVLLNGSNEKTTAFNAATKKAMLQQPDTKYGTLPQAPFATGVAAMAYDKRHNRLYYTPMFIDQLRYIDLSSMQAYYVTGQAFTGFGHMQGDEGKIVTRMVIAPDGYGYAITNDGSAFIKFSTGKKSVITQLGSLADDPSNKSISIHNRCSSWGGDMVADEEGNLFLISSPNNAFKINTDTKVATYVGEIQNLPPHFTVNGMVVDADGALLVSSAVNSAAYFVVDSKSLKAQPYKSVGTIFRSSDLANSNYLLCNRNKSDNKIIDKPQSTVSKLIQAYPNPVTTNRFTLQFNSVPAGDYLMEVTNVAGQKVVQRKINLFAKTQTQEIPLAANAAKGIYLIKIFDSHNKPVFDQKLMIQ